MKSTITIQNPIFPALEAGESAKRSVTRFENSLYEVTQSVKFEVENAVSLVFLSAFNFSSALRTRKKYFVK